MLYGKGIHDIDYVRRVKTAPPDASGSYYKPYSHKELLATLHTVVEEEGMVIREERYAVSNAGYTLTGALRITLPDENPAPPYEWLAFTTSNDRKGRLRFYLGGSGDAADKVGNTPFGFALHELIMPQSGKRTHTRNADLGRHVAGMLTLYHAQRKEPTLYANWARGVELTQGRYYRLMVLVAAANAIQWSRLRIMAANYNPDGTTLYDFLRGHGHALQWAPVAGHLPMMLRCRAVLMEHGYVGPAVQLEVA
jgi:hypothetical protein